MKLVNKFEISCGDKRLTLYNTVLSGIAKRLSNRQDFTKYIAFGKSQHLDTENITGLKNQISVKETKLFGYNYNPLNGAFYLIKQIELAENEFNGENIQEVAFCSELSGGDIINYAKIFDNDGSVGVTKKSGESLIITATLYMDIVFSQNNAFQLCGGENNLVKMLFGQLYPGSDDVKLTVSDSNVPEGVLDRQSPAMLNIYPASISFDTAADVIKIESTLSGGNDGAELILFIDGKACLRMSAKTFDKGVILQQLTMQVLDNVCISSAAEIIATQKIYHNNAAVAFTEMQYSCGVSDKIKNSFDFIPKESDKIYISENGNFFVLNGTDIFSVYRIIDGIRVKLDFSSPQFGYFDVRDISVDNSGRLYVLLNKSPYFTVYSLIDRKYTKLNTSKAYNDDILQFSLSEHSNEVHLHFLTTENQEKRYTHTKLSFNINNFSEQTVFTATGDLRFFAGKAENQQIIYDRKTDGFMLYPQGMIISGIILDLLKKCQEVEINKNLIFIKINDKWKMFDAETGVETALYNSGIRRIYVGVGGKTFVKQYSNNSLSAHYVSGYGNKTVKYDIDRKIDGDVLNVHIIGENAFIVIAKNKCTDCYYLPTNKTGRLYFLPSLANGEVVADVTRYSFKKASAFTCSLSLSR